MGVRKIWTLVAFVGFLGCFLQTKRKWVVYKLFCVYGRRGGRGSSDDGEHDGDGDGDDDDM